MPQRNDEEGGKQPRLSSSPAASVWGQIEKGCTWTTDGRNAPHTTESITEKDYVAFLHQFSGFANNPALAPFANVPCRCQRTSWVVKVSGTTSTPASIMLRTGPARTTMSCGRWRAFITPPVSPPITSGCSRVRATAAPISKPATSAWCSRPICWSRHLAP